MTPDPSLFRRYQDLQSYVGWNADDERFVRGAAAVIAPHFASLVDDFYAELQRHPATVAVITGGLAQIERLKGSLRQWLEE